MKKLLRQRKGEDGFTLIELLIVIIVLGILAGIVVFGVATFRADANSAACKANGKSVEIAAAAYLAVTPPIAPAINPVIPGNNGVERVDLLVDEGYLASAILPVANVAADAVGDTDFLLDDVGVVTYGATCS